MKFEYYVEGDIKPILRNLTVRAAFAVADIAVLVYLIVWALNS